MHDIDRARFEIGAGDFEGDDVELTAGLLGITDDRALGTFIGRVVRRARAEAGMAPVPAPSRALAAQLSKLARSVIPGLAGSTAAPQHRPRTPQQTGQMLGLELEGLSPEDQEFEVARQFLRLTKEAARLLDAGGAVGTARQAAQTAIVRAASRLAPGIVPALGATQTKDRGAGRSPAGPAGTSGRWTSTGRVLVLFDA